jgi:hypothetical protein
MQHHNRFLWRQAPGWDGAHDGQTVVILLSHCCYTVVTLLLHCCYFIVTVLLQCCYTLVTLLLHCCYTVVTLLLLYCYTLVTLLLHCCYTVVTLLLHCRQVPCGDGADDGSAVQGDTITVTLQHHNRHSPTPWPLLSNTITVTLQPLLPCITRILTLGHHNRHSLTPWPLLSNTMTVTPLHHQNTYSWTP